MYQKCYIREFKYSGTSFEGAVGDALPLNDAIGQIAMNFSELEDEVSAAIGFLLRTTIEKGLLVTSEMSFRAKVNVLSALIRMEYKSGAIVHPISEKDFNDLLYMCHKSEELRNKLLHSSWIFDHSKKEVRRQKLSIKKSRGFIHEEEPLTPGQVLDIADYIIYTAVSIEEYFIGTYPEWQNSIYHVVQY
jgi:hypothetical protein